MSAEAVFDGSVGRHSTCYNLQVGIIDILH